MENKMKEILLSLNNNILTPQKIKTQTLVFTVNYPIIV